jgi:hypothetical protein
MPGVTLSLREVSDLATLANILLSIFAFVLGDQQSWT